MPPPWTAIKELALNPRSAPSRTAGVFYRLALGLDLGDSGAAFHFHDLVAQKRGAFELEISRRRLHFILEFAQQLGQIEVPTRFADHRRRHFAPAQNRVEALL